MSIGSDDNGQVRTERFRYVASQARSPARPIIDKNSERVRGSERK
jgi:hypothetical protein